MPRIKNLLVLPILASILAASAAAQYPGAAAAPLTDEQKLLAAMHSIRSETLSEYVKELTSEKYGGRLTGTAEYDACADWVISLLKKWGVAPGGDDGTYFQKFPNPYTLVFPGGACVLHLPVKDGTIKKSYAYEEEFIPGGTSASGEVTAKGPGTAAITAESKDGGFKATCQVTVQAANVPVTGVSVSPAALTLEVGGTGKLTATVAPTGATDPSVTWSSDAPGVVTVDENGSLKALAAGTAVITAKSKANPSASAACTVTVNAPAPTLKSITINLASATLKVGDTLPAGGIPYTTDPADYGGTAAWASSNTEVLSFDGSQFQAVQTGSAEIILTIDGVSTRAAVTVQDSAGS